MRGRRIASFFWIESLVVDLAAREMLFDLDNNIQQLTPALGADAQDVLPLAKLYHNLVRRWSR